MHPLLNSLIESRRDAIRATVSSLLAFRDNFRAIPASSANATSREPVWGYDIFSGLDAAALYGTLAKANPRLLIEVGSGNSTKFARRAIEDHGLRTRIIAIDPEPRVAIGDVADEIIRRPVQDIDPSVFAELEPGDILFIDASHYVFQNSDTVALMMDVVPSLRPGTLVHIHDICWPYDYPPHMTGMFYAEQYLVGAYLLAAPARYQISLPNYFVSRDPELSNTAAALWDAPELAGVRNFGQSLWMEIG